jgi:hypothetical protein
MELRAVDRMALESMKGQNKQSSNERRDDEQIENATPREESRRCIQDLKGYGSDHNNLDYERHDIGNPTPLTALEDLEPSDHDRPRLHGDGDDVSALLVGGRRMSCLCVLHVGRGAFGFADRVTGVRVHVLLVDPPDV